MFHLVQLFSPEEAGKLIARGRLIECKHATIYGNAPNLRKSRVAWMRPPRAARERIDTELRIAAKRLDVDVWHFPDQFQFTRYTIGEHYGWHHDTNHADGLKSARKLSLIVELSPVGTYGGGLVQFTDFPDFKFSPAPGRALFFPSYLDHQVTAVSSGERYSLVNWAEGPRWR